MRRASVVILLALGFASHAGAGVEVGDRDCPPGTTLQRDGVEFACETPDGVGDGPFWRLAADGSLRIWGHMRRNLLHGPRVSFHETGARATEAEYEGGVLHGWFRRWNAEGRLVYEGRHDAAGEMHGTWSRWWENGNLRARFEMEHGRSSGRVETFHENGERASEGLRNDGIRQGPWTWWNDDGSVAAECRYARGAVVEGRCGN